MIITEKMIRELQRRVDISYEEAERFLRRAGGNIEIAESYARKKDNSLLNRLFRELEKLINATLIYRIKLYKGEDQLMNLPIFAFVILFFIIGMDRSLLVGVIFVIISLVADCNLQIHKVSRVEEFRFYKTVNKNWQETNAVESIKDKDEKTNPSEIELLEGENGQGIKDKNKDKDNVVKGTQDDDGYYEVTIDK